MEAARSINLSHQTGATMKGRIIDLYPQRGIIADHFTSYLQSLDATAKTISVYGRALKQLQAYFHTNGIKEPHRNDIRAFRDHQTATNKPATVQLYLTVTRLFFQWMEAEGRYQDITKGIKGAKVGKNHSKDHLTSEQVREILKGIDSKRDRAMIMLMVTAALRCIEVRRANIEDIRNLGDHPVLFLQGKGRTDKDDYVKLSPATHKAILAYLADRGHTNPADPLFTSEANRNSGGRLTTVSISRIVKTAMIKAGYNSSRLTAHSLRHTAATLNLLNGGTLQETQQLLRHSNINTTTIYTHNLDRLRNKSEARIEDAILGKD